MATINKEFLDNITLMWEASAAGATQESLIESDFGENFKSAYGIEYEGEVSLQ